MTEQLIQEQLLPFTRAEIESSDRSRRYSFEKGKSYGKVRVGDKFIEKHFSFKEIVLSNQSFLPSKKGESSRQSILGRSRVMGLIERNCTDGTTDLVLSMHAIDPQRRTHLHTVSYSLDGQKFVDRGGYGVYSDPDIEIYKQETKDLTTYDVLPNMIDTIATAKAFLKQVQVLNFDKPVLVLPAK